MIKYLFIFLSKTIINELLICDGEIPVSTIEYPEYLFQATKVFNIQQNQTTTNWVGLSTRSKYVYFMYNLLDLLLVDNANFIYSPKNVRRTLDDIMR